jgi:hypothetical protein
MLFTLSDERVRSAPINAQNNNKKKIGGGGGPNATHQLIERQTTYVEKSQITPHLIIIFDDVIFSSSSLLLLFSRRLRESIFVTRFCSNRHTQDKVTCRGRLVTGQNGSRDRLSSSTF